MTRPNSGLWLGLTLIALCSLVVTTGIAYADEPAVKPKGLEVGQDLPALESLDEQGKTWKSTDRAGKGPLVIYFYPGDFTGGCIRQAQKFQELMEQMREAGAEVVGVSGDEVATHKLFKETFKLPQSLLADPEGKLADALGVPVSAGGNVRARGTDGKAILDAAGNSISITRAATFARWTYIVGSDGKILARRERADPVKDAAEVLELIKSAK